MPAKPASFSLLGVATVVGFCGFTAYNQVRVAEIASRHMRVPTGLQDTLSALVFVTSAALCIAHIGIWLSCSALVLMALRKWTQLEEMPSYRDVLVLAANAHVPLLVWAVILSVWMSEQVVPIESQLEFRRLHNAALVSRPAAYLCAVLWWIGGVYDLHPTVSWQRAGLVVGLPAAVAASGLAAIDAVVGLLVRPL